MAAVNQFRNFTPQHIINRNGNRGSFRHVILDRSRRVKRIGIVLEQRKHSRNFR